MSTLTCVCRHHLTRGALTRAQQPPLAPRAILGGCSIAFLLVLAVLVVMVLVIISSSPHQLHCLQTEGELLEQILRHEESVAEFDESTESLKERVIETQENMQRSNSELASLRQALKDACIER